MMHKIGVDGAWVHRHARNATKLVIIGVNRGSVVISVVSSSGGGIGELLIECECIEHLVQFRRRILRNAIRRTAAATDLSLTITVTAAFIAVVISGRERKRTLLVR
jgi:hypothetical protein